MRACVVGAGPGGIVTAKVLAEDGFDVTVYDKYPDVGGVWAPGGCYAGLHNQSVRGIFAFAELPNRLHLADAAQSHRYLRAYAARFGVLDRLRPRTEVVAVRPDADGWRVGTRPVGAAAAQERTERFDRVVVASGAHHLAAVPDVPGRARFPGTVVHSNEATDPALFDGRRVVVVGGGKSALDVALRAADRGRSAVLVQRKANVMVPERLLFGLVTYKWLLFTRLGESLLPRYPNPAVVRPVDRLPERAKGALRRVMAADVYVSGALWRLPRELIPRAGIPDGLAHAGVLPRRYVAQVRRGRLDARVAGVRALTGDGALLDTGEELPADVVVFATGHRKEFPFLDPSVRVHDARGRLRLYRGLLAPGAAGLGFVGFRQLFNNLLGMEISAHWLSEVFLGRLTPPEPERMERDIDARLDWLESVMPGSMGYDLGPYQLHGVDELLHDMGLPHRRRPDLLSEYLLPGAMGYRYRGLTAERRRRWVRRRVVSGLSHR